MVSARFAALAALSAVVVASASATYVVATPDPKKCYATGERAIGAPGKPAVDYYPCCNGNEPRPKKQDDEYKASRDWGLFCGATGSFDVTEKNCHEDGVKAIGAPGYPLIEYKPCCSKVSPREKRSSEQKVPGDKWGKFCLGGGSTTKVVEDYVPNGKIRCAGAPGYPYVNWIDCGPGYKCAPLASAGWGSFCQKVSAKDCYPPGERNQGAPGYVNVPWLPCCENYGPAVQVKGNWGYFCPLGGYKKPTVIVVTNAPPRSYTPKAPAPKKPPTTKAPMTPPTKSYRPSPSPMPMASPDYQPGGWSGGYRTY